MKMAVVCAGAAALLCLAVLFGPKSFKVLRAGKKNLSFVDNRVAVLPIMGEIDSSQEAVRWLRRFDRQVSGVRAVVLQVNSPGGGVAPSQEIYQAVKKIKAHGKTVVVSMGTVAASGAYYLACPADRIFADPGTLTGSIGVYVEKTSAKKLLDKVGLKFEIIKSGMFKDTGNISRDYSPQERAYLQGVIDDIYDQFVSTVAAERGEEFAEAMRKKGLDAGRMGHPDKALVKQYVKSLSDGKVFTGMQARKNGLVDEIGDLDDAIAAAAKLAGIEGEPEVVGPRTRVTWAEYLTGVSHEDFKAFLQSLAPSAGLKVSYKAW